MKNEELDFKLSIKIFKNKVMNLVEQKNMTSVMNNTKWFELISSVIKMPFQPPYHLKFITDEDENELQIFNEDVCYTGDWDEEILYPFFNIEWVKVRPRYLVFRGHLVEDEIIDETDLFIEVLKKHSIPYEEQDGAFIIYGYKRI